MIEDIFYAYSDQERGGSGRILGKRHRDVVVVGHGVESDMKYLRGMGVDIWQAFNFHRTVDTKDMHQAWRGMGQGRSLASVLGDLEIEYENLHNAGNDAAYTLRAMVAIAVAAGAKGEPVVERQMPTLWPQ